jgi:hypothetical protein
VFSDMTVNNIVYTETHNLRGKFITIDGCGENR